MKVERERERKWRERKKEREKEREGGTNLEPVFVSSDGIRGKSSPKIQ